MTTTDEWVSERAKVIVDLWATEHLAASNLENAIAAFGQEAIERGKADLEDENKRLQEWNAQMVEKAASGGALDGYRELGQRVAAAEARAESAEAILARLENPDEALVEALYGPWVSEAADRVRRDSIGDLADVLALTLTGQEGENTDG